MFALPANQPDINVLPLWSTVFCLDCEVLSNGRDERCPACKGSSLVSIGRMLGGSLYAHRAREFQAGENRLCDITITVELQKMSAKDLRTTLERLTSVIAPKLARDLATLHVNVRPSDLEVYGQGLLHFPEREAA